MDMIKKIACTASVLLFVVAQAFSFYLIYVSHQEKTSLVMEKEAQIFFRRYREFSEKLNKVHTKGTLGDQAVTYFFRECMMEGSALYKDGEELCNTSAYSFDASRLTVDELERGPSPCFLKQEAVDGKQALIFWEPYSLKNPDGTFQDYLLLYMLDITYLYEASKELAIKEILISLLLSFAMALLLVALIQRITRPLQATNETQRQLIGSMSHELKTPLTAIKGYSETLLSVRLSEEQAQKALGYINRESGRLSRLTEKMMELTRLYEPECRITLKRVPFETLFEDVEESVRHKLEETGIRLQREGSYQGRSREMDVDLMASFCINLINNSILASEPGSVIYLGADKESLWVRDMGAGIPPKEVEKVRKAFYRVDKSRSTKSGNMGLGLALCDQIAAVHHGRMQIESKLGEGTKVSCIFP